MKGRGATTHIQNRFDRYVRIPLPVICDIASGEKEGTHYQTTIAKSIVNPVRSPDLHFSWSANPYQGCEHGCSYCYARPSHQYWGYDAGLDFESRILVKENAPDLLKQKLTSKSWKGETIMLSGNTDCYQPIEKKLGITRAMLEICLQYRQSVALITKNHLLLRDLDLIEEMGRLDLIRVAISITTSNETLRQKMEPRTSSIRKRMDIVSQLNDRGVPVIVMMAPIIPGINDHEIMPLTKLAAERGARDIRFTLIRLNDEVEPVFVAWLDEHFPDRKEKVLSLIRSCRDGNLGDKRFHHRMRGEGPYAEMITQQFDLARQKFLRPNPGLHPLNTALFQKHRGRQLSLFEPG